jgi:hypothetical protein
LWFAREANFAWQIQTASTKKPIKKRRMVQVSEKQQHRRQPPQKQQQQQQGKIVRIPSSSSYYLLLFVKILLVLIILLWLAPLVTGGNNNYRQRRRKLYKVRNLRSACQNENVDCARLVPEESMNCVHTCMSPTCYAQIYESKPLEDGEVDVIRGQAFETCVQEELRAQIKEEKRQKLQQGNRREDATATLSTTTESESTDL